jgi:hypothetical protein
MRNLSLIVLLLILATNCNQNKNKTLLQMKNQIELYNTFDSNNHLQPVFDKISFDTLHSWEFGWAILEPINIAPNREQEKLLSKRLSPGQKALYFFWYLDEEVTNGGFIQFYWNDFRKYLPPIIDGLNLIGDKNLLDLIQKADQQYFKYKDKFVFQRNKDDWKPLYDSLKEFSIFDSTYYSIHDKSMDLMEQYARQHTSEFVKFK